MIRGWKQGFGATIAVVVLILTISCDRASEPQSAHPTLQILAPVGSERYTVGQTAEVRWLIGDPAQVPDVRIDLSLDSGRTFQYCLSDSVPSDVDSFSWANQNYHFANNCALRVSGCGDKAVADTSGIFSVGIDFNATPIIVTRPKMGDVFHVGDSLILEWQFDSTSITSMELSISLDDGLVYRALLYTTVPASTRRWGMVITDTLNGLFPMVSDSVFVRVQKYSTTINSIVGPLSIKPKQ